MRTAVQNLPAIAISRLFHKITRGLLGPNIRQMFNAHAGQLDSCRAIFTIFKIILSHIFNKQDNALSNILFNDVGQNIYKHYTKNMISLELVLIAWCLLLLL